MSVAINRRARDAITARLAAAAPNGFNAVLAEKCAEIGIPDEAFAIDFGGHDVRNFFLGLLPLETMTESVLSRLPLLALGAIRAQNFPRQKASYFSGQLDYGVQVWLAWNDDRHDFERLTEAVQETLLEMFNKPSDSTLGAGLIYDYEIAFDLTPVNESSAARFVRGVQATLVMEVEA